MEELFKFIVTRPADRIDAKGVSEEIKPSRELYSSLSRAKLSERPAIEIRKAALEAASQAIKSQADVKWVAELAEFRSAIDDDKDRSLADLEKLFKATFGSSSPELIKKGDLADVEAQLSDALVLNAILSYDACLNSWLASELLQTIGVIRALATGDKSLEKTETIHRLLRKTLALPGDIFPITGTRLPSPEGKPSEDQPGKPDSGKLGALIKKKELLISAYTSLTRVSPEHLARGELPASRTIEAVEENAIPSVLPMPQLEDARIVAQRREDQVHGEETAPPATMATKTGGQPLLLRHEVFAAIDPTLKKALSERNLDITKIAIPLATDQLNIEISDLERDINDLSPPQGQEYQVMGGKVQAVSSEWKYAGAFKGQLSSYYSVPHSFAKLVPAGIGDLLVVKQNLKRYEARELAHIENVLIGESKERMHRRARTTEETITTEIETKKEEERDQQSTERFEMKTEASQIQKEDTSLKLGLAVTAKYGPVVEVKATADFAMNNSKEESTKVATSYSKDVTSRATSRIFERRREERILKTTEVFEEVNKHGLNNVGGPAHVIGQYQWVDKVYEAQIFNYGKRLLFDIMLPEPAAFLLYATAAKPAAGANLVKPIPFSLAPDQITEWNYTSYVRQYEVIGVNPPPQPYTTVAKSIDGKGGKDDGTTKTLEIPLPDGYQAIGYEWASRFNRWDNGNLDVLIVPEPVNGVSGTITLAVKGWKVEAFIVSFAITCQRSQRALDDWKLKTHASILQAYQKLQRDYEEKLAALQIQAAQQFQGRNPLENEGLVRAELKKSAISTFTAQHFDLFGAITAGGWGYPQPDLSEAEAEGKYIRFFEQAFEWEQMMYFFYPYFWGRKKNWPERALAQDTDPQFAEFIKAGSARIVLSVRPGFEHAVAHFCNTGEIWDGGDLPPITSPLYVPIIQEIKERDNAKGAEIAQGDPWDVHLPTTLVVLRDKPGLPSWQKDANGNWLPV